MGFVISNFKFLVWWLRQVSGDAAYENYLRSATKCCRGTACRARHSIDIMSREEFYLDSLRRRYSTISRCC